QEWITTVQRDFVKLYWQRLSLSVIDATLALYTISSAVMQTYTDSKRRKSALDFPDLITTTVSLLEGPQAAEWVLYKLDEGVSHILVDESQDTSPEQWALISALSREFFTGLGANDAVRTVFAVGDEKQSIYSFQGAAPREFATQGRIFETLAKTAQQDWHQVPLTLSFRTVDPVLNAVDRVFADRTRTPGLTSTDEAIEHRAKRVGQAGLVEIWPTEAWDTVEDGSPWAPLAEAGRGDPVARVAERIASQIDHWLQTKEVLPSTGRTIEPGDILILVRKRQPFAPAMVAALKKRNIAVAGADRIHLLDQIAIQDLLSLGDFLTLPEDDLALAEVLKSPIFGFDDDDLLALAPSRKQKTLWKALLDNRADNPRHAATCETLKRWRKQADFAPPYEFFARLFDKDRVRDKLLARLGPEAGDALDAFIDLALSFDEQEPPSLSGFLTWIRADSHEVKRDLEMGRNEVRVMTVHGAKGLEAPIVFLPDTCSRPASQKPKTVIALPDIERPQDTAAPFLWTIKGATKLKTIKDVVKTHAEAECDESNRLLYVAMTRARDRLYISGFEGHRDGIAPGSWYEAINAALASNLMETTDHAGGPVLRHQTEQTAELEVAKTTYRQESKGAAHPDWAHAPAPQEPQLSIPLAPSRLAPYEIDDEGEPLAKQPAPLATTEPQTASPSRLAGDNRFLRGTLTHALLQHLPNFDTAQWTDIAQGFVDVRGAQLAPSTRKNIVLETLAVLTNPQFAPLFGPSSRAEVPIVANIPRAAGEGPDLRLSGAIDRLADRGDEIFVVDFKTNRAPPKTTEAVADAYLLQLASYRLALRQIYPNRVIRAALLWTDGPRIMEIEATILERYEDKLWQLDTKHLDA
ncbi:MAG: double-strand break repair helicase AddA, partial [Alphaproteobacteria bacterium]|nr:double-strand break repair helicase AddA [Alphaproteobacteria bacterium]